MLSRVLSGMQDGVDFAAILAATSLGIPVAGTMPRGFLTLSGPKPHYAALYGAKEHASSAYPPRTRQNIMDADGTLVIGANYNTRGTALTLEILQETRPIRLYYSVYLWRNHRGGIELHNAERDSPEEIARWIESKQIGTLNVAGPSEQKAPGIQEWATVYLIQVFRIAIGHGTPAAESRP